MTPLSTRQSWICLKVASGRGSARSTPLITAPTCGVSFSTLIVDDAMADLLWLAAIPWRTPALSSSSRCRVAAVHRQRHACHELRLVAAEIEDGRGHVCRLAEAAEWMALLERLMPSRITEKWRGHPSSAWRTDCGSGTRSRQLSSSPDTERDEAAVVSLVSLLGLHETARQPAAWSRSEIAEASRGGAELVAEGRGGDGDERRRALTDRPAPQLGHAMLRHHLVDHVLVGGDDGARAQGGLDARDGAVHRGGVGDDEGLPALGEGGGAHEIGLPARRRHVVAAQRLRGALAEEIHLHGSVHRAEFLMFPDVPHVVGLVGRPEEHVAVVVEEGIHLGRAEGHRGHCLEALVLLESAGGRACLHEAAKPVCEELGMDAEVPVLHEETGHRIRHRSEADLDGGAVRNALGHEARDGSIG